jgi:hypothetical protein
MMGYYKKEIQSISEGEDNLYSLMNQSDWDIIIETADFKIPDELILREIEDLLNDCSTNSNNSELENANR